MLLDNFDSYTYNLLDYFGQLGIQAQVVRNDVPLAAFEKLDFQAIVLSPGPGVPQHAGNMLAVIHKYHQTKPMLGICLGHQALGEYFGATLQKGIRPMHGKISEIICRKDAIFDNLPDKMPVVRYHSLVINNESPVLVPLAYTADQELMAFRHVSLPLYALQFHPEAILTTYGLDILRNWARLAGIK
ncbi:glutamine amidotransferase [Adhaeribacter aerolatus]|uniref:Glutamine amidotransferase n=1 Tax=Adhaeribacter aerolatus TaxID=670289 RepID=A0A512ATH8_9BACT|nr:glutamine amidotransferase [Adhaeribacter aerolatus]